MKNFNPGPFFQALCAEDLAAQRDRLSPVGLRRRFQLCVGDAWSGRFENVCRCAAGRDQQHRGYGGPKRRHKGEVLL